MINRPHRFEPAWKCRKHTSTEEILKLSLFFSSASCVHIFYFLNASEFDRSISVDQHKFWSSYLFSSHHRSLFPNAHQSQSQSQHQSKAFFRLTFTSDTKMAANTIANNSNESDLSIFDAAKIRWLNVEEIIALLSSAAAQCGQYVNNYDQQTNECILEPETDSPSSPPTSGTILLYDRIAVRNYKADGHEWIRKRSNPSKVREDHVKLRFQGKYRVGGTYVHSAETATLHRRTYRLIKTAEEKAAMASSADKQELVLVHYLDTDEATKMTPTKTKSSNGTKRTRSSNVTSGNNNIANSTTSTTTTTTTNTRVTSKRIRTANSYAKVLDHPPQKQCSSSYSDIQPVSWNPRSSRAVITDDTGNVTGPKSDSFEDVNFDVLWDMINSDSALGDALDELIDNPPPVNSNNANAVEQVQSTTAQQPQNMQQRQQQYQQQEQDMHQQQQQQPSEGYQQFQYPRFSSADILPVEV